MPAAAPFFPTIEDVGRIADEISRIHEARPARDH